MILLYLSAHVTCFLIPPPLRSTPPPLLPFRWMWAGCSGLFVFGKEIPCLCGGGCPWVFVFFNHILFDLLLPLLPPVCWSVHECARDVSISARAKKSEHCAPFMCAQTCGFHVPALTFSPLMQVLHASGLSASGSLQECK